MSRLEARLDNGEFSTSAAIPGRQVQPLQDPGYGGDTPARLQALPSTRDSAWTTLQWEGNPGDSVAFVIKSEIRAWQEVVTVAANPEGVLRRLAIGSPGWFGRSRQEVGEVAYDYLANAVRRGPSRLGWSRTPRRSTACRWWRDEVAAFLSIRTGSIRCSSCCRSRAPSEWWSAGVTIVGVAATAIDFA